jgi:hypothetical protein
MTLILAAASLCAAQPKAEIRRPAPLDTETAQRQGREVVNDLLSRQPEDSTRTNLLRIRPRGGSEVIVPVVFDIRSSPGRWVSTYLTLPSVVGPGGLKLVITGQPGKPNEYVLSLPGSTKQLSGNETMLPFAGSDFWIADLGLEFLHWPRQLLLRKELRKGQSCHVIESTNPAPAPGAYSRVVTWFDIDSGGIVHADAHDLEGRILKQFDPSELQKVEGRLQVKEIEIRNRKTGSRSWVVFDL